MNAFEEMEIIKATTSDHMLNIMHNINSLYQMLHFRIRQWPAQIYADDTSVMVQGPHV